MRARLTGPKDTGFLGSTDGFSFDLHLDWVGRAVRFKLDFQIRRCLCMGSELSE